MNVIIAGMTPIGQEVAVALANRGYDVTVIDSDPGRLAQAEDRLDAFFVQGHESTLDTLRRAQASDADLIVYTTRSDELNLFGASQAKQLGELRTIAMVRNSEYLEGDPGIARNIHGVDFVLAPIELTAREIHRVAHSARVVSQTHMADGRITIDEIPIDPNDPIAGTTIDQAGLPESVRVAALVRAGVWVPASPRERLQVGDHAILVGRRGAMLRAEKLFRPRGQRALRKSYVIGGGRFGLHVSRAFLAEDVEVTLIDRDRDRCELRSSGLGRATILHGDGTDVDFLQQEGVGSSDVVVACTNDDETNLVVSLLAERLGTPHAVTLVHKARNVALYRHLGLKTTVNRPLVMAQHVVRLADRGEAADIVEIADGMLIAAEFNIGQGSRIDGHSLGEVGLPSDVMPCFALAGADVVPVSTSTVLNHGDLLVALLPPKRKSSVEKMVRRRSRSGTP